MDYNAALQLMENGSFSEAKAAFLSLGDYSDSSELAAECQSEMDYYAAMVLMESREYEAAGEIYESLGSFKDSASLAVECANWIIYLEAQSLRNSGDHAAALPLLETLALSDFEDSDDLAFDSSCTLIYEEAERAYDDELFYSAYTLFMEISFFNDAASRAEDCIQDYPSSGQVYRNDNYSGTGVSLRIRTPRDDTRPTFLKIYTEDGVHVSSVFIRGGDSPTVRIPSGTYMIKQAVGVNWFGQEEMFGDDNAYYQVLLFNDNQTTMRLTSGSWNLTLRGATNGNVGTRNESRSDF